MIGDVTSDILRDEQRALKYYEIASDHGIMEAALDLFLYYAGKYRNDKNHDWLDKVYKYKREIEQNKKFNEKIEKEINDKLSKICNQKEIDISFLLN